jgi:hypothetical protein
MAAIITEDIMVATTGGIDLNSSSQTRLKIL